MTRMQEGLRLCLAVDGSMHVHRRKAQGAENLRAHCSRNIHRFEFRQLSMGNDAISVAISVLEFRALLAGLLFSLPLAMHVSQIPRIFLNVVRISLLAE